MTQQLADDPDAKMLPHIDLRTPELVEAVVLDVTPSACNMLHVFQILAG
jgi:hypothetical protein